MEEVARGKEEKMPIISSIIQIYTAVLSPWNRRKQMMFANTACEILWVAIKMRSVNIATSFRGPMLNLAGRFLPSHERNLK